MTPFLLLARCREVAERKCNTCAHTSDFGTLCIDCVAKSFAREIGPLVEALTYYRDNPMAVMAGETVTARDALANFGKADKV